MKLSSQIKPISYLKNGDVGSDLIIDFLKEKNIA